MDTIFVLEYSFLMDMIKSVGKWLSKSSQFEMVEE